MDLVARRSDLLAGAAAFLKSMADCFRVGLGTSGAVRDLGFDGLAGGSRMTSGGGGGNANDTLDCILGELELDEERGFFFRSPGLTIATCDGLVESAMTTRASMGPRTLAALRLDTDVFLFLAASDDFVLELGCADSRS